MARTKNVPRKASFGARKNIIGPVTDEGMLLRRNVNVLDVAAWGNGTTVCLLPF